MPTGTCDPATRGEASNEETLQRGTVLITVRFGWDGVSVRPNCVGPIESVRVVNAPGNPSWWYKTEGKRGQPHSYEIPPGTDVTFNATQARQRGFDDNTDFYGLTLSPTP
jgi:hypothetical protein